MWTVSYTGEENNSEDSSGNEDHHNETAHTTDNIVRLLDTDPIVFHALPSTVSADGEWHNYNISPCVS